MLAVARTTSPIEPRTRRRRGTRSAFYEGDRALARGPAVARADRVRGVRRRRAAGSWRGLRGGGTLARLPARDRAGGASRVLAVGVDVARHRGDLQEARGGRSRL